MEDRIKLSGFEPLPRSLSLKLSGESLCSLSLSSMDGRKGEPRDELASLRNGVGEVKSIRVVAYANE